MDADDGFARARRGEFFYLTLSRPVLPVREGTERTGGPRRRVDAELVERARRGNARAREELVRILAPCLLRLALRLTDDSHDAEDMVSEALYRGVVKLDRLREPAAVVAWFQRILVHHWRDRLRSRRPRDRFLEELAAEPLCEEPPGAELEAAELSERVRRALATLPPMQRAVLALHFEEGLCVGEIASVLDARPEQVKANLWHARRRLRAILGEDLDVDA